jgi:hypothetical protein
VKFSENSLLTRDLRDFHNSSAQFDIWHGGDCKYELSENPHPARLFAGSADRACTKAGQALVDGLHSIEIAILTKS